MSNHIRYLRQPIASLYPLPFVEQPSYLQRRPLPHPVVEQVGGGVYQDAGKEFVVPVVVVCQTAHRSLDAGDDDRCVGIELFEDARVDIGGTVGTEACLPTWGVGIVVSQTPSGGVVVHHGIHGATSDAEEEPRTTELAEVAQVIAPVGLRDDGHAVACRLKCTPDDGRPKRRMVNVGIAGDKHHIHLLPSQALHLLQCYRQEMSHIIYNFKKTKIFCQMRINVYLCIPI